MACGKVKYFRYGAEAKAKEAKPECVHSGVRTAEMIQKT